jgi:cysteine synthase A
LNGSETYSVLDAIGNTPLVRLKRVVPTGHAEVWLKLEGTNPTGSYKDRMAVAQIRSAIESGRLDNATAVECTGGSTGTSVAFVCAAMGIPCAIVTSDAFSQDKTNSMRAFGAEVIIEPCENGKITRSLWERMWDRARKMQESGGYVWLDQFNNPSTVLGFERFADEVLEERQSFDAFCAAVGTGGMLIGAGGKLKQALPEISIVAVEPESCSVLSGNPPGPHTVDGTAAGYVPPHYDRELVNSVIAIPESDARQMCQRLAKEEGIFAGTSTGLNICAALKLAAKLGANQSVLTVACDTGFKYLSGNLFEPSDNHNG